MLEEDPQSRDGYVDLRKGIDVHDHRRQIPSELKRELYSYSVADGPTASRDFYGWETVFSLTNG